MGNKGEAATSILAPVVLQYCRSFLFLLLALQSDPQKPLDFRLLLFAMQGLQNVRVCVVVEF
jgi:hypothetical protein